MRPSSRLSAGCEAAEPARSVGLDVAPCWPDLYRYGRLVALFNIRHLRYQEDVLDVFAGVLSEVNRWFICGFISGLPQMFFDAALLWQPHLPMDGRIASCRRPPCQGFELRDGKLRRAGCTEYPEGSSVELIELSRGTVRNQGDASRSGL